MSNFKANERSNFATQEYSSPSSLSGVASNTHQVQDLQSQLLAEQKIRERIEQDLTLQINNQQSQIDQLRDQMKYWREKCLELNLELNMIKVEEEEIGNDKDQSVIKLEGDIQQMQESIEKLEELNQDLEIKMQLKDQQIEALQSSIGSKISEVQELKLKADQLRVEELKEEKLIEPEEYVQRVAKQGDLQKLNQLLQIAYFQQLNNLALQQQAFGNGQQFQGMLPFGFPQISPFQQIPQYPPMMNGIPQYQQYGPQSSNDFSLQGPRQDNSN